MPPVNLPALPFAMTKGYDSVAESYIALGGRTWALYIIRDNRSGHFSHFPFWLVRVDEEGNIHGGSPIHKHETRLAALRNLHRLVEEYLL